MPKKWRSRVRRDIVIVHRLTKPFGLQTLSVLEHGELPTPCQLDSLDRLKCARRSGSHAFFVPRDRHERIILYSDGRARETIRSRPTNVLHARLSLARAER